MSLPGEETPSALESCYAVELKIRDLQGLLLGPGPETLDRSAMELEEVVATLEGLVSVGTKDWNPAATAACHQIRRAAGRLQLQIDHASNFWLGWLQMRLGTGYTQHGLPAFANPEARSCFEG